MRKVYISGQITGLCLDECEKIFGEAEEKIKKLGLDPVNPLKNGLPKAATWVQHMGKDVELLLGCDAIYLLPNWSKSKGAKIELAIALQIGIAVINDSDFNTQKPCKNLLSL